MDNIEKIEKAQIKKRRKIAAVVFILCVCAALLFILSMEKDRELHIGWAGGAYPGSDDFSELRTLAESVVEELGYSDRYPAVVIDEVNIDASVYGNPAYKLLLLPAHAMGRYEKLEGVVSVTDLSDSQVLQDIGLEKLCAVLINWEGKTDEQELKRLEEIAGALK